MATSGTYSFNPASGEFLAYAFSLCGIRRTAITPEHLTDARMGLNLMLSAWGNSTPNLWTVDLVEVALVPGQATYDVDPNTIMILDAYIRTNSGTESQLDRIIWPISRTEYAAQPNKTMLAPPTIFWFDRLRAPTITLWQTPDDQEPYLLRFYRCISIQDANLPNGETVDIPPRWLDALSWGLAARLAVSYAPDRAQALDAKASQALMEAREQDVENTPLYLQPMLNGYWVR